MSFNQWKLLNNIRDAVTKLVNDKNIQNPFSKEFLQTVNKLPVALYDNEVIKYLENKGTILVKSIKNNESLQLPIEIFDKKSNSENKTIVHSWKISNLTKNSVTLPDINDILSTICTSKNEKILLETVEKLILDIKESPEVKNKAVKSSAIRHVLKAKLKTKNEEVQGACRELLAILGYVDPVPARGIRILAIDGGGVRGLLVLEMLKKLEELTGKKIHELFDYVCGVSTGSILCFSMGIHLRSLDDIIASYEALSKEIFSQSAVWGTGSLVWSHAYYDTSLWEKKLREYLGSDVLISTARNPKCPKLSCVSAVVNQSRLSAFVFRNYSLPWRFQSQYPGSYTDEVWQAARASAAAPTYFHEYKLGNLLHQNSVALPDINDILNTICTSKNEKILLETVEKLILDIKESPEVKNKAVKDGGILVNNPSAIAVHEAKLLWPNTPIQCVVSFGTGRTVPMPMDFNKFTVSNKSITNENTSSTSTTSWAGKFYKILDSATDTEAVHTVLSDLLPENVYYRFNPFLTEMISMVENNPKKLEQLRRDALMYLRRNEDKFQEAAKTLTLKKTYLQKLTDDIAVKREMYGI